MQIRAHFDGHVIVPDEPVQLPLDQPLSIYVEVDSNPKFQYAPATRREQQKAWQWLMSQNSKRSAPLPDKAISRAAMYEELEGT